MARGISFDPAEFQAYKAAGAAVDAADRRPSGASDDPSPEFFDPAEFDAFKARSAAPSTASTPLNVKVRVDPQKPAAPSVLEDVAKTIPSAAARGVMGVLGAPADLMNLADTGYQYLVSKALEATGALSPEQAVGIRQPIPGLEDNRVRGGIFPASGLLQDATNKALKSADLPELYKPKTVPGEYVGTTIEFAPGALGGATAAQRIAQVAAPALASETAGQAARQWAPGWEGGARLAGALGGGVGAGIASQPFGTQATMAGAMRGVTPDQFDEATALIARSRSLPGGGLSVSLDEALNTVTGGQATRPAQLARVVANSGGEGQDIASAFYARRPGEVDQTTRAILGALATNLDNPTALGGRLQEAAQAGIARTPEGMALAEARAAAGPRMTPEQAGQVIQPELRQTFERREGMRAALGDADYAAARAAPETIGIDRTLMVERPGEPIITYPDGPPRFMPDAPAPLGRAPTVSPERAAAGPAPESFTRWLASRGGVPMQADTLGQDLNRVYVPGHGTLARRNAPTWDEIRVRMSEDGWRPVDRDGFANADDVRDFVIDRVRQEAMNKGRTVRLEDESGAFSGRRGQDADEYRNALSSTERLLDDALDRAGVAARSLQPEVRSRTLNALMSDPRLDPLDAYERVVGGMREPYAPYVKSTTVQEQISAPRFGQVDPSPVVAHIDDAMRMAKGPVLTALQQARKTLFDLDGRTPDLSVAGLHGAREAIGDLIAKAQPQTQRALLGVRDRLDRALTSVPEYERARAGFEAASRALDPFDASVAPGKIVNQADPSGHFTVPPERAPGAIDVGPSSARAFNDVASPAARQAYEGHLTTRLLDAASDGGGISAGRLRASMRAEEDQLAQFPGVRERLEHVALAREGLAAVERSPLGQVAAKPKVEKAIRALFNPKPVAGSEREVASAMRALAQSDPDAARQLARVHLETVFDDATRERRGLPAQYGGAAMASAVAGNPQQRRNLEAALRALPHGQTMWGGIDKLLASLRATGYRPLKGSDTAFNRRIEAELAKEAGSPSAAITSVLSGAAAGSSVGGLGGAAAGSLLGAKRAAADAWTRTQLLRSGKDVARYLFDPKALPELRMLVRAPAGSPNVALASSRLFTLAQSGTGVTDRR